MNTDKNSSGLVDNKSLEMILRVGGDKLLKQLIEVFLEDIPKKIKEGRNAVECGDFETAGLSFHSLVSMSGNMGIKSMMELSQGLEQLALMKKKDEILPKIVELEVIYTKTEEELNKLLNK